MVVFRAVQFLGGDELHACHGDGGKNGNGRTPRTHWGMVVSSAAKFGGDARQQQEPTCQSKDPSVDDPVRRNDADILGICRRGKATHQSRQDVADTIGDDAALQLLSRWGAGQAAHGGGSEVADGLDGVDGKEQSDGDAGGGVKADDRSGVAGAGRTMLAVPTSESPPCRSRRATA